MNYWASGRSEQDSLAKIPATFVAIFPQTSLQLQAKSRKCGLQLDGAGSGSTLLS